MPDPSTRTSTPPQSGRIAQQSPTGAVVVQGYAATAFPPIGFVGQLAINTDDQTLNYFDDAGAWQGVVGSAGLQTFYQSTAPVTGMDLGDLWYNSALDNQLSRWDGATWVVVPAGSQALANTITGVTIQTAASGPRIVITEAGSVGELLFYSADAHEDPAIPSQIFSNAFDSPPFYYSGIQAQSGGMIDGSGHPVSGNRGIVHAYTRYDSGANTVSSAVILSADTVAMQVPTLTLAEVGSTVDLGGPSTINPGVFNVGLLTQLFAGMTVGPGAQPTISAINFGTASVTILSGGVAASTGAIAHGLPSTPKYVGVIPNAATSLYYGYLAGGLTSTTMNLGARLVAGTVGSNTTISLLWFALC